MPVQLLNPDMIVALNLLKELAIYVRGTINHGLDKEAVSKAFLQAALYFGMLAGLGCFKLAKQEFKEMGI